MSRSIAAAAAALMSGGAGKSGNPCARLTALCRRARRVISRMTDSANCAAFSDGVTLDMRLSKCSLAAVQPAVVFGGAEDLLHVALCFRVREVVDELVLRQRASLVDPAHDLRLAGVVAGEHVGHVAELREQVL